MVSNTKLNNRWFFLAVGVFAMLFSGILYAWSILKVPFQDLFGWGSSALAFNFTLTMCTFCLGSFAGSHIYKRFGHKIAIIFAGILVGAGFILTGLLSGESVISLYLTYGILAGAGIGIAYNVLISTVSSWFPDKKGLCSGCLMMGFGASTLLLGSIVSRLFAIDTIGWSKTYIIVGICLALVLIVTALILKRPDVSIVFPEAKKGKAKQKETFEAKDYTTKEMICRFTFWRAFLCLVCLTAVGNSVISFARDLVLSVGATAAWATTLVGVLAVCNGLGRILTGALFDAAGRKVTMVAANIITIFAAGVILLAVQNNSLPLCVAGLCLTGLSYGSCPTVSAAFTAAFYGQKHFSTNFSITNFNLMVAAFIATISSNLFVSTGSYAAPFTMLLILSSLALILNFSIRRP